VSLQPDYVFTLPGITKDSTKTADRLLQYVLLNTSFQTLDENRSMFLYFPLIRKFFQQSSDKKILHSHGFLSKIYLQTQYG